MGLWRAIVTTAVLLIGLLLGGVLALGPTGEAAAATPLVGTFTVTPGSCSGGTATGTYLRMVLSGGTNAAGPYFSNSDSSCSDNTYTPLAPGTDKGLVTGSYQPEPSPSFDGSGNALANRITAPVAFEGIRFATATNPVDPQTGLHVPAPSIAANGTTLSGNVQSFAVSWNNQQFNQGSPKPDGSSPGNTTPVTGVYSPSTGAYTLQWSSQVVGGPFNGFSAFWNVTGVFIPAAGASPAAAPPTSPASSGAAPGIASSPRTASPTPAAGRSGNGAVSSPGAPASAATRGTTAPGGTPAAGSGSPDGAARAPRTGEVLSARTSVGASGGWSAPTWLVVLVAAIAVLGLGGVLWSERQLRRRRDLDGIEPKGATL